LSYAAGGGLLRSYLENLSHTLIGLAAGESFAHCLRSERGLPQPARRSLFVALAVIGGNVPDLDLAWSYGRSGGRLGYMLEHRGYTHTVLGCLLLAGLLYAGAEWWMRRRGLIPSARDRIQLAIVAVVGTLLHLGMDALNSYGVHPFWPFDNRWIYGDSIFIAEPLFWLCSAPLIFLMRSTLARWLLSLVVILGVGLSIWVHGGALLWDVGSLAAAAGLVLIGRKAAPRAAALTSAAAMVLVVAVSLACGAVAVQRIDALASRLFPAERVLDHVLTPTPTDPVCWDALVLATNGDRYVIRHAVLSLVPQYVSASSCPQIFLQRPRGSPGGPPGHSTPPVAPALGAPPRTPPVSTVDAPDSASIQWLAAYSMSRAQLVSLVKGHCDAAALMQFARAPFAYEYGRGWFLGDLRFVTGFQIEVEGGSVADCSIHVPWVPPRMDLLRAAQ
jgi:inner membrane protein